MIAVSFAPEGQKFIAHFPLESLSLIGKHPEKVGEKMSSKYESAVRIMGKELKKMEDMKKKREIISARMMWRFGGKIFSLVDDMEKSSFYVNGLYDHLTRDLGVKKMWLEKVVMFRRHIPNQKFIPPSISWSKCYHSPRIAAKRILDGNIS